MFKDIRATIEIDLTKTEEEILNNVDKDAKWGIKKAEKEGLVFEESKKSSDLAEFYRIYKKTIIAGGIKPDNFDELNKEHYKLFLAKKEDKIIAGAIIELIDKDKFKLEYNASLYEFLKSQPNNLLYWNLILWGKKNSFKIFDLGGYQLSAKGHLSGVNKFKERWGGEIKTYPVYSWNLFYILGRKIIRNIGFIKKTRDWLKLKLYLAKESYKRNSIAKKGFWNFIKKVFKKFIFDKNEVIVYSSSLEKTHILQPKIKCKFMEITDLDEFGGLIGRENVEERMLEGDKLFGMIEENKVIHSSWLKFNEMNITEVRHRIKLEKGEACIYDSYTDEDFRGKGLYPSMLSCLRKFLKEKGFTKAYIYVESDNEASVKGIEKAGFVKETAIKYIMLFGIKTKKIKDLKKEELSSSEITS